MPTTSTCLPIRSLPFPVTPPRQRLQLVRGDLRCSEGPVSILKRVALTMREGRGHGATDVLKFLGNKGA